MYYNLLSQIKNAIGARKEKIMLPFSRMDLSVATVLVEGGYLKSVETEMVAGKKTLVIRLPRSTKDAMHDFRLISKPSRHFYKDYRSLNSVKQGYGLAVLTTSKGIMSNKEAKKQKVGGEYLFEIW